MIFAAMPLGLRTISLCAVLGIPSATVGQSMPSAPDPVRGARMFLQCRACHTVTPGGANIVGPNLAGIFEAKAATRPGYVYSSALTQSGLVWTVPALDRFLTRPNQAVRGNKMVYAGMPDARSRSDVVAYLKTLKAGPNGRP